MIICTIYAKTSNGIFVATDLFKIRKYAKINKKILKILSLNQVRISWRYYLNNHYLEQLSWIVFILDVGFYLKSCKLMFQMFGGKLFVELYSIVTVLRIVLGLLSLSCLSSLGINVFYLIL